MVEHIKFPSIESFSHVVRDIRRFANKCEDSGPWYVVYRGKTKLHGTNSQIYVEANRVVAAGKRTSIINYPDEDNVGFASWVMQTVKPAYDAVSASDKLCPNLVIHGEWAGPGVQKGVASSKVKEKFFAIFAVDVIRDTGQVIRYDDPDDIENLVGACLSIGNIFVLPWQTEEMYVTIVGETLPYSMSADRFAEICCRDVEIVESCDPFVKEQFGIDGIGEGLVYYPIRHSVGFFAAGEENFRLRFKAKGNEHKMITGGKTVSPKIFAAPDLTALASALVSEARLSQIYTETFGEDEPTRDKIGMFVRAVSTDVIKECQPEITESGFEWKQLSGYVSKIASNYIKIKLEKIDA